MKDPKKPDPVDVEVGQRIRIQRLQSGLSQTALAEQLGVTFQQVQKYEKGVNRVGAGRLTKIAEVLAVPVSTLFGVHDAGVLNTGTAAPPPHPLSSLRFRAHCGCCGRMPSSATAKCAVPLSSWSRILPPVGDSGSQARVE